MENRILINGEWYVKESEICTPEPVYPISVDTTDSLISECQFGLYRWKAQRLYRDAPIEDFYPDFDIEFIDFGINGSWDVVTEVWDNPIWFKLLLAGDSVALAEANESMTIEGIKYFIAFLDVLDRRGWFTESNGKLKDNSLLNK